MKSLLIALSFASMLGLASCAHHDKKSCDKDAKCCDMDKDGKKKDCCKDGSCDMPEKDKKAEPATEAKVVPKKKAKKK